MKQYFVQITDRALADMEEIYTYIAEQLQEPENAMGLRQLPVDNFSAFLCDKRRLCNCHKSALQCF